MNTWNETTKRWLPLVEEMERLGFEDYAEPEIYRSAEDTIAVLLEALEEIVAEFKNDFHDDTGGMELVRLAIQKAKA